MVYGRGFAYDALVEAGADPESAIRSMDGVESDGSGVVAFGEIAYAYDPDSGWQAIPRENVI